MYFGVLRSMCVRLEGITDLGLVESLTSEDGFPCRIIWPRIRKLCFKKMTSLAGEQEGF